MAALACLTCGPAGVLSETPAPGGAAGGLAPGPEKTPWGAGAPASQPLLSKVRGGVQRLSRWRLGQWEVPRASPAPRFCLEGGAGRRQDGGGGGKCGGGASPARPPSHTPWHACWQGSEATGPLPSGTLRPTWGESWEVHSRPQGRPGQRRFCDPQLLLFWEAEVLEPFEGQVGDVWGSPRTGVLSTGSCGLTPGEVARAGQPARRTRRQRPLAHCSATCFPPERGRGPSRVPIGGPVWCSGVSHEPHRPRFLPSDRRVDVGISGRLPGLGRVC